ncbi:NAD(P)-dependent oxidoreductase [Alcaligenes sp. SDU_A2]|uniref:NAD(P)-dependent oxidoreductase n=1 Tax=Alcaligenes sp. SDU_A2 TaxID=3136634 RepID=UPI00311D509B
MKIGFCGLGLMGQPMVRRLLQAGHQVRVWNRSADKARELVQAGALWCDSPAAMAGECEIVMLCVFDAQAVHDVVLGEQGLAQARGTLRIVVDHSSIAPRATREMAASLQEHCGAQWLDAPVSGGVGGAEQGTLAIMVGGCAQALEQVRPVLSVYSQRVTLMGPVGAGQVTKLCNQTIVATTLTAIAEALSLARDNDVDAALLSQALGGGWADSVLLQLFVPRMTQGTEQVKATIDTMLKDLDTVADLARSSYTTMPVAHAAQQTYRAGHRLGIGARDVAEIVKVLGYNFNK